MSKIKKQYKSLLDILSNTDNINIETANDERGTQTSNTKISKFKVINAAESSD